MITLDVYKQKLMQQIQIITNEEALTEIDVLISSLLKKEAFYITNSEQKKAILSGLNDFEKGDCFTQEEIDKQDLEWLNEK